MLSWLAVVGIGYNKGLATMSGNQSWNTKKSGGKNLEDSNQPLCLKLEAEATAPVTAKNSTEHFGPPSGILTAQLWLGEAKTFHKNSRLDEELELRRSIEHKVGRKEPRADLG